MNTKHINSVGRAYSCWMLNWWCITWPVGFKRLKKPQRPMVLTFSQRRCGRFGSSGTWCCVRNVANHSPNDNSATSPNSTCFHHPHEGVKSMYSSFTTQGGEIMILCVCVKPFREFHKEIQRFQYTRIQGWTTNPPTPAAACVIPHWELRNLRINFK